MISVAVVDDHPVVRQGLVSAIQDEPEFEVVGSAGSAEEGIALVGRAKPDVVLLDLELPGMDGLQAIPLLLEASPVTGVLVFTAYDTDERVLGALRAGAKGYLLKGAAIADIARAIRDVASGGSALEPRIAAKLVTAVSSPGRRRVELSPREREVLQLVADGLPTKQIARSLAITERTVKFHVASLFQKLDADSRAQAVAHAAQRGLLQTPHH